MIQEKNDPINPLDVGKAEQLNNQLSKNMNKKLSIEIFRLGESRRSLMVIFLIVA